MCAAVELVMLYGHHLLFYVFILRNNSDPANSDPVLFYCSEEEPTKYTTH